MGTNLGQVFSPRGTSKDGGKNPEVLALLGACHQALGEFREAVRQYKSYLESAGLKLDVLNSLGQCHYELGEFQEAAAAWEKSLAIDPRQEHIRVNLERIKR